MFLPLHFNDSTMKVPFSFKNTSPGNIFFFCLLLLFILSLKINAQKLDVAYVPTPEFVVERMLNMADVGPGDYLIDLGCGDGRIVIAAAKRGASGHGVDLDPKRIEEARENAIKAGVTDKVMFFEQNIFDTDFSKANVIAMYLFPSINIKLRPLFLEKLEPGSRIVSHDFGMDEWKPDQQIGRMENHAALLWIVPAKAEGKWKFKIDNEEFVMSVGQKFQEITIQLKSDASTYHCKNSILSGKRISFMANDSSNLKGFVFSGKVKKGKISGVAQIRKGKYQKVENWTACKN